MTSRPTWGEYFLGLAQAVSVRGDCVRSKVGAVIVNSQNEVVMTGFNGTEPGGPSCLKGECPRAASGVDPGSSYDTGPGACVAVHAEANAILRAGRAKTQGSVLYVTRQPCQGCEKLIKAAGIIKVVWPEGAVEYLYDIPVQPHSH